MKIEDVVEEVVKNANSGKWLSCTFRVEAPDGTEHGLGIKAFGKWVQRVEVCGLVDGLPERKTLKALRASLTDLLTRMLKCT